jgi:acyl carrier protein
MHRRRYLRPGVLHDKTHRLPTIGSAIANTQVYVFDESGTLLPPGTPGELHIGGLGLARGYRNRPELTAKKFISHPNNSGARLFKTGDRGKLFPDGQIVFLGRMDEQVQVRGFRVEPGDVAATLNRHPEVQQSAVVTREVAPGDVRLIAYLVAAPGCEPALKEIRDFLTTRLPDYMVPATFVRLETLRVTANGKVDRKSLPAPDDNNILRERAPTAPRTEMETLIAAMLARLLKLECIDVEENFFSLGGHSLLGAQLVARLRDTFSIDVPLRIVFEAATVAELSSEVERLCLARAEAANEIDIRDTIDLGASMPRAAVSQQ